MKDQVGDGFLFFFYRKGEFRLKGEPREGRLRGLGSEALKTSVEVNPSSKLQNSVGL